MTMSNSRGGYVAGWIEDYCVVPSGPDRGRRARLSVVQCQTINEIYNAPDGPLDLPVTDKTLAAYLALVHLCGYEALSKDFRPCGRC